MSIVIPADESGRDGRGQTVVVPGSVQKAAENLCRLKITLDDLCRTSDGQKIVSALFIRSCTCALAGETFFYSIIPFAHWIRNSTESQPYRGYVNSFFVLGTSTNGYPEHITTQDKIQDRINFYATNFTHSLNVAKYDWWPELGICIAHEGKHRVAFMQYHNQKSIAARVREFTYPEPNRLRIIVPNQRIKNYYEYEGFKRDWFAILDNEYIQPLLLPEWTYTYLTAYGVKTTSWAEILHKKGVDTDMQVSTLSSFSIWSKLSFEDMLVFCLNRELIKKHYKESDSNNLINLNDLIVRVQCERKKWTSFLSDWIIKYRIKKMLK